MLGERIRALRIAQNLSVSELARRAGVSKSLVSQIEHNRTNPSVETVQAIASALEAPLFSFFLEEDGLHTSVVRSCERLRLVVPGSQAIRELLTPDLNRDMVVVYSRIGPSSQSSRHPASHKGEEFIYVLHGELTVTVHDNVCVLGPGDSFYFDARLPHLFSNRSEEEDVEFICGMSSRVLPPR
jgi:transcriptional regulator with XRE-family HTH domain